MTKHIGSATQFRRFKVETKGFVSMNFWLQPDVSQIVRFFGNNDYGSRKTTFISKETVSHKHATIAVKQISMFVGSKICQ